mmetsp:Transcript_12172/g.26191  ORF Transcript_12172/g.26191 Transcript_12172/m.26191 type:complete len:307 (-) Transcript_12172:190-1110(-)
MLLRSKSRASVDFPAPLVPARCHLSPCPTVQFKRERRVVPSQVTFRLFAWTSTRPFLDFPYSQKSAISTTFGNSSPVTISQGCSGRSPPDSSRSPSPTSPPSSPAIDSSPRSPPSQNNPSDLTNSSPSLPILSSVLTLLLIILPPSPPSSSFTTIILSTNVTFPTPSTISSGRCVNKTTCVLAVSLASPTPCTRISIRNPSNTLSTTSRNPSLPRASNPSKALSNTNTSGLETNARTSSTRRISPVLRVLTRRGRRGYMPNRTDRNLAAGESRLPPEGMRARWTVVVFGSRRREEWESKDTEERKW